MPAAHMGIGVETNVVDAMHMHIRIDGNISDGEGVGEILMVRQMGVERHEHVLEHFCIVLLRGRNHIGRALDPVSELLGKGREGGRTVKQPLVAFDTRKSVCGVKAISRLFTQILQDGAGLT